MNELSKSIGSARTMGPGLSSKIDIVSFFLWRRERNKETSTPSKASPYMGRMQLKIAESADLQGFCMARKACAPAGRAILSYIPACAAP